MKKLLLLFGFFIVSLVLPSVVMAANAPYLGNSTIAVPSNSISADGASTGTITVNLKDSGGTIVAYDTISLSSSNDSTAVFNNTQKTDASGNVTFTVTSTTAGSTKITLTDNTNAATFTDWTSVNFYTPTGGCANIPAAPVLISAVSNSVNSATLTWADSPNPVSNYLVSFGTTSGKYVYGNPNIGGQGTTSYTVGSLSNGKTYYFVVAANNVCGASKFSNEMSVTVGPTSAPTLEPTATPEGLTAAPAVAPTAISVEITETPMPEPTVQNGSSTIKNIAITLIASGVVILGIILVTVKIKTKKGAIPPITFPGTPSNIPPTIPPAVPPETPPMPPVPPQVGQNTPL